MQPITQTILNIFDGYRMQPTSIDEYETTGKPILASQIEYHIANNQPISFAMLGLPFKSINHTDKVLGSLPDLGEELTVKNFEAFNAEIQKHYANGIRIYVASDGYAFNDILGVSNTEVDEYKRINLEFRSNGTLTILDLNDMYVAGSIEDKRARLMQQFGYSWERIQQEMLFNPDVNMLYKGMMRFMDEELADKPYDSGNQRHKTAKKLAREMMLRNEAFNNLVRKELPNHIRLSMHQSVNNGYKYSFKLIPGNNTHHSPWHSAIVMRGTEAITMHKADAQHAGYTLVSKAGQPYNFVDYGFTRDPDGNGNEWAF